MDTKAADDGHVNATTKDGSGRSNSVERNNFPDFCKLERVQDILDRNKRLLHHVKSNHDSQRSEALAKNFTLLQEINDNIELVQSIYTQIGEDYEKFMKSQTESPAGKAENQS